MTEELGKIEKPAAEDFKLARKLFYVPLVFSPREPEPELSEIVNRYWQQVAEHLSNLEAKLGTARRLYHELIPIGGETGLKTIRDLNEGSYTVIKSRVEGGAELQPFEDADLLAEFMDWSRALSIGLQSQKAFTVIYEAYVKVQESRNTSLAGKINESLKKNESGILIMREGHQLRLFPDIEVFYVAPPALDEIKRWVKAREAEEKKAGSEETATAATSEVKPEQKTEVKPE